MNQVDEVNAQSSQPPQLASTSNMLRVPPSGYVITLYHPRTSKEMERALFEITTEGDFEKTPKAPFGWIFWTLLIHIKIFLMWGQAVTVKVLLPYLKMSLYYYHSTQINECFLRSFFFISKLFNFENSWYGGTISIF